MAPPAAVAIDDALAVQDDEPRLVDADDLDTASIEAKHGLEVFRPSSAHTTAVSNSPRRAASSIASNSGRTFAAALRGVVPSAVWCRIRKKSEGYASVRRVKMRSSAVAIALLLGCGSDSDGEPAPGSELGRCVEGFCEGSLQCTNDVCVDPAQVGGETEGPVSGASETAEQSSGEVGESASQSESASETANPGSTTTGESAGSSTTAGSGDPDASETSTEVDYCGFVRETTVDCDYVCGVWQDSCDLGCDDTTFLPGLCETYGNQSCNELCEFSYPGGVATNPESPDYSWQRCAMALGPVCELEDCFFDLEACS